MEIKEFFTGLQATLTDALKGTSEPPAEPEAPTLESVAKAVEELAAKADAPASPEGEPEPKGDDASKGDTVDLEALQKSVADAVTEVIAPLKADAEVTREALEKALDRIAQLEGGTAVRKSATADEAPDGELPTTKPEPKEALFKSVADAIRTQKAVVLN